jgi:hypothetical protein
MSKLLGCDMPAASIKKEISKSHEEKLLIVVVQVGALKARFFGLHR